MSLSVITPTCGRSSFRDTAGTVIPQLRQEEDEWIVVADGEQPFARKLCREARTATQARIVYAECKDATSQFGNAQRDLGLGLAKGSHVCFLDDDDIWCGGAGDAFRLAADTEPHAVHVFKTRFGPGHHWHGVLWLEPQFREQNIATCMVMFPRSPRLPRWMEFNSRGMTSDFGWMEAALGIKRITWHARIVSEVRPVPR